MWVARSRTWLSDFHFHFNPWRHYCPRWFISPLFSKVYSSRIHIWIIRSSNLVFSMETSVYYSSYQCLKEMESQYFTCLLVLQIAFNIQLTLSLHRQKQYMQLHTPFQWEKGFLHILNIFCHFKLYATMSSMETHKQGKPNRKPSIFFIISRKFSSGSKIKPWPVRFLREWILPESQALETPEGKLP